MAWRGAIAPPASHGQVWAGCVDRCGLAVWAGVGWQVVPYYACTISGVSGRNQRVLVERWAAVVFAGFAGFAGKVDDNREKYCAPLASGTRA